MGLTAKSGWSWDLINAREIRNQGILRASRSKENWAWTVKCIPAALAPSHLQVSTECHTIHTYILLPTCPHITYAQRKEGKQETRRVCVQPTWRFVVESRVPHTQVGCRALRYVCVVWVWVTGVSFHDMDVMNMD